MLFKFSFKHMESSDALQTYAQNKLGDKINKFVTKPIEVHMIFSVDKHNHSARCVLTGGDGFNIDVEHTCNDIYASLDKISDKLMVQLQKQKARLKDHKNVKSLGEVAAPLNTGDLEHMNQEVDADDIVKYEKCKCRKK